MKNISTDNIFSSSMTWASAQAAAEITTVNLNVWEFVFVSPASRRLVGQLPPGRRRYSPRRSRDKFIGPI